jgi:hypothetical protein
MIRRGFVESALPISFARRALCPRLIFLRAAAEKVDLDCAGESSTLNLPRAERASSTCSVDLAGLFSLTLTPKRLRPGPVTFPSVPLVANCISIGAGENRLWVNVEAISLLNEKTYPGSHYPMEDFVR